MDYGFDALSVHVLVDLSDPESVVGIKAVAEWARDQDQAVQVWPFLREPINTAAEVPKGTPSFEAYKARRGFARRRYKSAPSMMYQAEVFSGMAHLPRLTALCRP